MPLRDKSGYTPPPAGASAAVAARNHPIARRLEEGRIGWVLLWLLGIPVPILLGLYFLRGCT